MPPSSAPPPPPGPSRSDRYVPDTQNTRALLRSLEELRDSLADRVEQLSQAVERLRAQAGELERAFAGDMGDLGMGRLDLEDTAHPQSGAIVPSSRRRRAIHSSHASGRPSTSSPPSPSMPAHQTSSSIRADVSSLSRPITMQEITALLDRASQSVPLPASSVNPPPIESTYHPDGVPATPRERPRQTETNTYARISALRTELRTDTVNLGTASSAAALATLARDRGARREYRNARQQGELRRATRLDNGIALAERLSSMDIHPRRQGMPPTNLRQPPPTPIYVRSAPLSPASTITPDHLLSRAFSPESQTLESLGSESPLAARHIPLPDVMSSSYEPAMRGEMADPSSLVDPAGILVETTESTFDLLSDALGARSSTDLNLASESARDDEIRPNVHYPEVSPSTSTAPRWQDVLLAPDSLTSRGMRVESRMSHLPLSARGASSSNTDSDQGSWRRRRPLLEPNERYFEVHAVWQGPPHRQPIRVFEQSQPGSLRIDDEIRAIQREEREHLRSLAQDIVRSRNPASIANRSEDWESHRSYADREAFSHRHRAAYSPTAAATVATSSRTETSSTSSTANSRQSAPSSRGPLQRSNEVDSPLNIDQLNHLDTELRASLQRSRRRMMELAEIRRDYVELQNRPSPRTEEGGERDASFANLENLLHAEYAASAGQDNWQQAQVFEGSGQRRDQDDRQRERRSTHPHRDHDTADSKDAGGLEYKLSMSADRSAGDMRGTGTAGPVKEDLLDAHLWLDAAAPRRFRSPQPRPYISILHL
ncbi:hypothetical protein BD324DRAFT_639675 [Kockovaella imperatae]|uniref:Uncharacterized protein n=1 Tax=Kockovaella imperatae TaxID=4999 RepID=A0A1Y1U671_9TREE|nr:hypothetical protein BD324DRAFT_639675 [Kockovaella imperatae]ORX33530.1 hypothetical protein BD324DRAFT_639675 [Kockovaella imperatae]